MDEITLLRRVRQDVPAPDPQVLARARARLLDRARPTHPRGGRVRMALPLLVAAAVVLVVVAVGTFRWPGHEPRQSAAATVLHRAAQATGDLPEPGPGQYLAVETRSESLGYVSAGDGVDGAYRSPTVQVDYVPADRDGTWVRSHWSEPATAYFHDTPGVRRAAQRDYVESAHADDPTVERAAAGAFGNSELGGSGPSPSLALDLDSLPRDPQQLLDRLAEIPGQEPRSQRVMDRVSELLRSGLVPLDLRRALYDAVALLPDVEILANQATLDGRTGTAIGISNAFSSLAVVIDPDTGDYLGERSVQLLDEGPVPAGTVTDLTSVRVRVVDSAP